MKHWIRRPRAGRFRWRGVRLLREAPLFELGRAADAVRRRLHRRRRHLHRRQEHQLHERLLLRLLVLRLLPEEGRARRLRPFGGGALRQDRRHHRGGRGPRAAAGGAAPDWGIGEAVRLVRAVKRHRSGCTDSPRRKCGTSRINRDDGREGDRALKDAGLDSIPGGGAEILDDEVRREISPKKIGWEQWAAVMREAHLQGLRSTATMMFGSVETPEGSSPTCCGSARSRRRRGLYASSPGCSSRGTPNCPRPAVREASALGSATPWVPAVLALSRILCRTFRPSRCRG